MRDIKFKGVHPEVGFVMDVCVIDWMHDEVFFDQGSDVGYPIDKCKLMQFTGVKDKNGVEIYEGYILRDNYGKAGLVKYFESDARFEVVDLCEISMNGLDTSRGWEVLDVIGSIHTHPELLGS